MGLKVLLIDVDIRKPSIHKYLVIDNLKGISNILIESESSWQEYVKDVLNDKNFDVITAGTIPPDASRLLGSKKFKDLIQEINLNSKYDYVLFNTTPVIGLSDALLTSENIDGAILVVSLNYVDINLVKESIKRLKNSKNINLLGLVTNSTSQNRSDISNYYNKFKRNIQKYNYSIYANYKSNEKSKKDSLDLNESNDGKFLKYIKGNNFLKILYKNLNKFIFWLDN